MHHWYNNSSLTTTSTTTLKITTEQVIWLYKIITNQYFPPPFSSPHKWRSMLVLLLCYHVHIHRVLFINGSACSTCAGQKWTRMSKHIHISYTIAVHNKTHSTRRARDQHACLHREHSAITLTCRPRTECMSLLHMFIAHAINERSAAPHSSRWRYVAHWKCCLYTASIHNTCTRLCSRYRILCLHRILNVGL